MARKKRQLHSKSSPDTSAASTKLHPLPVPQYTKGAGNNLGLSLMLHSQVDKYFLTSGSFEGFKVSQNNNIKTEITFQCMTASFSFNAKFVDRECASRGPKSL